jgi:hypothetical protein
MAIFRHLTRTPVVQDGSQKAKHHTRVQDDVASDVNEMLITKGTDDAETLSSTDENHSEHEQRLGHLVTRLVGGIASVC